LKLLLKLLLKWLKMHRLGVGRCAIPWGNGDRPSLPFVQTLIQTPAQHPLVDGDSQINGILKSIGFSNQQDSQWGRPMEIVG